RHLRDRRTEPQGVRLRNAARASGERRGGLHRRPDGGRFGVAHDPGFLSAEWMAVVGGVPGAATRSDSDNPPLFQGTLRPARMTLGGRATVEFHRSSIVEAAVGCGRAPTPRMRRVRVATLGS